MQSRKKVDFLLAESFKSLARKTPIDKITIKEITDKAGVTRITFYNHFQDKYELLDWIIQVEVLEPVIPLIKEGHIQNALIQIFTNILNDKEFFLKVVKLEGTNTYEKTISKYIKEILLTVINEKAGNKKEVKKGLTSELIAEYYAQSMAFIVMKWAEMGMTVSPEQMTELFRYITSHSLDEIIADMEKE